MMYSVYISTSGKDSLGLVDDPRGQTRRLVMLQAHHWPGVYKATMYRGGVNKTLYITIRCPLYPELNYLFVLARLSGYQINSDYLMIISFSLHLARDTAT